jgi:hypothetical protein
LKAFRVLESDSPKMEDGYMSDYARDDVLSGILFSVFIPVVYSMTRIRLQKIQLRTKLQRFVLREVTDTSCEAPDRSSDMYQQVPS